MGAHQVNRVAIVFLFFCSALHSVPQKDSAQNHILYLMHTGNTEKSLEAYQEFVKASGSHDFELIEELGLILLDQGNNSRDPETQLLALFGAGISSNERALYIVENGITSANPELQLISLSFLSQYHSERADQALQRAMTSDVLIIRLEAAFHLAKKKDPKAIAHTECLMGKIPEALWPIFPQFFAVIGTPQAKNVLRKMLTHRNEQIRIATVITVAEHSLDDFLPAVRRLASHQEVNQQEACAAALGVFKDENSVPRLQEMAKNPNETIQLAAYNALYKLGREDVRNKVEEIAKRGNLYAIHLLGTMHGSQETLAPLLKSDNIHIRANAAGALLELRDSRSLLTIAELLLTDTRDLTLITMTSPGKSLEAWRVVPSGRQNFAEDKVSLEMSLNIREELINKAVELPENEFLALATIIFERHQNDLIPVLIEVLINHPTHAVIALLKKYQQKAGAPLIRNYCNLALYRLKEPGPYAENLVTWVTQQQNADLIQFRPVVPWEMRENQAFHLTPKETSRLLVDTFDAFVVSQDDKGINVLISMIKAGNSKNKYALIGLLMRAVQ